MKKVNLLAMLRTEENILLIVIGLYLAAAIVGIIQLYKKGVKFRYLLLALIALAVTLESVILIFRAVAIKAVPLTGLFESMMVMTIAFGITYIAFSIVISQAWFGSVMAWLMLAMVVLTATVAAPAAAPSEVAQTPWAIAHGLIMVIAGAMAAFSAVIAHFFLFSNRKLKQRDVSAVIGRMPNMERLERMNMLGVRACFILLTFGIISGIGLAVVRQMMLESSVLAWLFDPKIICILTAWMVIAAMLLMRHLTLLSTKGVAYMTIIAFLLILIAFVAVTILGITRHTFQAVR
jgi:ABC-type uncharacterized transport system permease subunit